MSTGWRITVREETLKAKVCLVGEAAVGKTSLIRRYVLDQFEDKYITTLGAKVSKKEMNFQIPESNMDINLVMIIWDIMGEKSFRELTKEAFFHGTKAILAVCDLTRYNTLRELDDWIEAVFGVVGEVPVIYAVNKVDLKDEVMIMYGDSELDQSTRAFNAEYFYTSAKTGENVHLTFEWLGKNILRNQLSPEREPSR
ncbi:MAG: Rab family GTPase [Thermoplasmata archaeon]